MDFVFTQYLIVLHRGGFRTRLIFEDSWCLRKLEGRSAIDRIECPHARARKNS